MALKQSLHALGTIPMPLPSGPGLCAVRTTYTLTADLAANDIIEMGSLPANCVPVDLILDNDDLDSGTTATASIGFLTTAKDDLTGALWLTTSTALRTAATGTRADALGLHSMSRVTPTNTQRSYGVKITADTDATSGTIGLTLMYRLA